MLNKKKTEYNKFKDRFKSLNQLNKKTFDIYLKLNLLHNNCKKYNISTNYDFLVFILKQLKKVKDNCSSRLFKITSPLTSNDSTIKLKQNYIYSFNYKYIEELKNNHRFLSVKETHNLYTEIKNNLKSSKDKLQYIEKSIEFYKKNILKERFYWSSLIEQENLNFILIGTKIRACKLNQKWVIYEHKELIFDNLPPVLNLRELETKIIDYFNHNNFDYNHLFIDNI